MTKRHLQIALGVLWLLDGLLQLQPNMFTGVFAKKVILSAATGQPSFVSLPMHWFASMFLLSPVLFNSLVVIIQLSIGLLILNKRTIKAGLIGSVIWGLLVWIIGEGYGGIFSGQYSLLMGAPGAAVTYSLLAMVAFPSKKEDRLYLLAFIWSGIWILGGMFFMTNQHSITSTASIARQGAIGAPSWLASIDNHVAGFIAGQGGHINNSMSAMVTSGGNNNSYYWLTLLIGLAELFVGIGVLLKTTVRKLAIAVGIILLTIFWVIGQGLGGYYTGLMTDLNTAPLLMLLGVYLLFADIDKQLAIIGLKIKQVII